MSIPVQITFRHASDPTGAITAKIHERTDKLSHFHQHITSCQVVIEEPHHHHHKGNLYQIRVNLLVPGHTFVVSSETNEDVYVAVRDTFDVLVQQLEEFARIQRGEVKHHHERREEDDRE